MNAEAWQAVDDYFDGTLVRQDALLRAALDRNQRAGLPAIDVAPNQGKLLYLLARMMQAKTILEIGTLGGYSTIWLARALPEGGRLISLEFEQKHADIARENIASAGLSDKVEIRVGPALESLPALQTLAPFDLFFIDADKRNNPHYLAWALKLARPGSVIIGDNVVRSGRITDSHSSDANIQGLRQFIDRLGDNSNLSATAVQTLGGKGWDGFALAIVERVPAQI